MQCTYHHHRNFNQETSGYDINLNSISLLLCSYIIFLCFQSFFPLSFSLSPCLSLSFFLSLLLSPLSLFSFCLSFFSISPSISRSLSPSHSLSFFLKITFYVLERKYEKLYRHSQSKYHPLVTNRFREYFETFGVLETIDLTSRKRMEKSFFKIIAQDSSTVQKIQQSRPHYIEGKEVHTKRALLQKVPTWIVKS